MSVGGVCHERKHLCHVGGGRVERLRVRDRPRREPFDCQISARLRMQDVLRHSVAIGVLLVNIEIGPP